MRYKPIDQKLFVENRKKFAKKLKPNSVAIFNSNDELPRNGDQFFPFRQNSDFFYLSGIDQPKSILVLYPDCNRDEYKEILFVEETSPEIAIWHGDKLTKDQATEISGIENIQWLDQFDTIIVDLMANCDYAYLNTNENIRYASPVQYRDLRFIEEMKKKYPLHTYMRAAPIMSELRTQKSPIEIELMKEAIDITKKGFMRTLEFVKPGVMEYEIEAEIISEFIRNRAGGYSFAPIIASGSNACSLHYDKNNDVCNSGELLLMDFGAEYAYYPGDLSRTIPVNGKYTDRQKQCYESVLKVQKEAINMLVVGTTIDEYHEKVCKLMEEEMIKLGLFSAEDVKNQNPDNPLYKKYYMHGTSHFMGLDVHDLGFKQEKLKDGMVFSCEPGIYIREEGIGIRIENDILVTDEGPVDLTADIPREVEEIEELMNK